MDIGYVVTVLGVILVSMMFHELMHGVVALKFGDETARFSGRLTLNPLKHIDPFMTVGLPLFLVVTNMITGASLPIFGGAKPVPFNPANVRHGEWGIALMAFAGPFTNLVIAFCAFFVAALIHGGSDSAIGMVLSTTVLVNLGFFVFNLLPIPPLDGARVMYALAPDFARRMMDIVEQYGTFFVFIVVFLFSEFIGVYMMSAIQWILAIFTQVVGIIL